MILRQNAGLALGLIFFLLILLATLIGTTQNLFFVLLGIALEDVEIGIKDG